MHSPSKQRIIFITDIIKYNVTTIILKFQNLRYFLCNDNGRYLLNNYYVPDIALSINSFHLQLS